MCGKPYWTNYHYQKELIHMFWQEGLYGLPALLPNHYEKEYLHLVVASYSGIFDYCRISMDGTLAEQTT